MSKTNQHKTLKKKSQNFNLAEVKAEVKAEASVNYGKISLGSLTYSCASYPGSS